MKNNMPNTLTELQKEILTGTLLGDACLYLPNKNGNPYLSIKRSLKDRVYLDWQATFFDSFLKRKVHETTYLCSKLVNDVSIKYKYTAVEMVSRCAPAFLPFYNKWYPNGKKLVPKDLILTPLILTEWFCDDGCVSIRKNNSSLKLELSAMGFCDDDLDFLKDLLEKRYDDKFCISKNRVLYCSDAPARKYFQEIDSYIPLGMERKACIWRSEEVNLFGKEIGQSRLKRQEEIKNNIEEFLKQNKSFSMLDLAKYTNCIYTHHNRLEPDYETLTKYLKPYSDFLIKENGIWFYKH
jgi:hypothetical protein